MEELEKITNTTPDMTAQDLEVWINIDENLETLAAYIRLEMMIVIMIFVKLDQT